MTRVLGGQEASDS